MSDIHKAEPGDIYADPNGTLWRVVATCHEPTVCVEAVEPHGVIGKMKPGELYNVNDEANSFEFIRERMSGGVSGFMWHGFKRILPTNGDADG